MATRKELQKEIDELRNLVGKNSLAIESLNYYNLMSRAEDKGLAILGRHNNYSIYLKNKQLDVYMGYLSVQDCILHGVSYKTARDFVNSYTPVETKKKTKPVKKTKKK